MKKTLQIARLELSLLFYSPIAWLLMIVLFFQVSYGFFGAIESLQRAQSWYKVFDNFISHKIFTKNGQGVLSNLLNTLYLYIPLITMSLMSKETSSGTIKLLYSSPIKISQIVGGKFIAMMTYNLILIGLMLVVVAAGALSIDHFEYAQVFSALAGIFLLLCAYAAIGLFMSSLTTYQVVAAISTSLVFALLSYVGAFWQSYDFFRDVAYSLAMPGRTVKMLNGLVTTRDIMYFVVIIGMFLAFTSSKLSMARDAKSALYQCSKYVLIIIAGLTVTYLTSRQQFIGYYDATANKRNTIHTITRDLLRQTGDDPIEVTEYVNLYDAYGQASPQLRISELDRWEQYLRFKANIKLKWVYYYDMLPDPTFFTGINKGMSMKQIAEKRVKYFEGDFKQFKSPEEMHKIIDLKGEDYKLVMQLKYKGRTTLLRVFQDRDYWPGELEVATAIKRLLVTVPKVVFVGDGYERNIDKSGDRHYKQAFFSKSDRHSLVNRGFDLDTISLAKDEIPANIAALVIADRRTMLEPAALKKLKNYVDGGGNLFIAAEGSKKALNDSLLAPLGIQLMAGSIVQPSKDFSPDMVKAKFITNGDRKADPFNELANQGLPVLMPGLSGLSYQNTAGFKVVPLLVTDGEQSWNKKGQFVTDSANLSFSPAIGDQRGSFPVALSLTRAIHGREQRILVTGDADFLSNARVYQADIPALNGSIAGPIFGWFAHQAFPINIAYVPAKDSAVVLSENGIKVMKILYLWLIPGLMFASGTILLIRRKRK
jgi:ABC-2 type transport system permease protein